MSSVFHTIAQVDRPDAVAISSAMTALTLALNWERALTLFHRLPPRKRDVVSYGAAMSAASAGKHWELALFWLYEMKLDKLFSYFLCVFLEVVSIFQESELKFCWLLQ